MRQAWIWVLWSFWHGFLSGHQDKDKDEHKFSFKRRQSLFGRNFFFRGNKHVNRVRVG
jgi:hypothetical protein